MSIGFDRSPVRRRRELNNNKDIKGKYNLRNYLGYFFGFTEHQKTATFGLVCKLTMIRNTENAVLNKDNATNNAKIKIIALEWHVPH